MDGRSGRLMRVLYIRLFVISILLLSLTSCGAKVGGSVGSDCYECEDADAPCSCKGPGYGGYYNPDALDMFRPGTNDDINSPVW